FVKQLHDRQLGLLLDIVPNHMAACCENPWWRDVLAKGEASEYASYFDIDWAAGSGKVLVPILPKTYGESLESGELSVLGNTLVCCGQRLPLRNLNGPPTSVDELDSLLSKQSYRLAYWRKATDSLNYRRFFDINDLVGIRAERAEVFEGTHARILELVAHDWI